MGDSSPRLCWWQEETGSVRRAERHASLLATGESEEAGAAGKAVAPLGAFAPEEVDAVARNLIRLDRATGAMAYHADISRAEAHHRRLLYCCRRVAAVWFCVAVLTLLVTTVLALTIVRGNSFPQMWAFFVLPLYVGLFCLGSHRPVAGAVRMWSPPNVQAMLAMTASGMTLSDTRMQVTLDWSEIRDVIVETPRWIDEIDLFGCELRSPIVTIRTRSGSDYKIPSWLVPVPPETLVARIAAFQAAGGEERSL